MNEDKKLPELDELEKKLNQNTFLLIFSSFITGALVCYVLYRIIDNSDFRIVAVLAICMNIYLIFVYRKRMVDTKLFIFRLKVLAQEFYAAEIFSASNNVFHITD